MMQILHQLTVKQNESVYVEKFKFFSDAKVKVFKDLGLLVFLSIYFCSASCCTSSPADRDDFMSCGGREDDYSNIYTIETLKQNR